MVARGPRLMHLLLGPSRILAIVAVVASIAVVGADAAGQTPGAEAAPVSPPGGTCVVDSLPSFVAQGEFESSATVGDVITVSCDPTVYGTGSKVKLVASQLYTRCNDRLVWLIPNPYSRSEGRGVTVTLDPAGNATAAVLAGPGC